MYLRYSLCAYIIGALALMGCGHGTLNQNSNTRDSSVILRTHSTARTPTRSEARISDSSGPSIVRGVLHNDLNVANGSRFTIHDFVVRPAEVTLRIVDILGLANTGAQYRAYSIREAAKALKPVLMISGGSSASLSFPVSLGLVEDNGRIASALNRSSAFASGVFCLDKQGNPSIQKVKDFQANLCHNALQSGPLIVEPGAVLGILSREMERPPYVRFIVAIDGRHNLHFITTSAAHLYELAQMFVKSTNNGGLGIVAALNLGTGDQHSALYVQDERLWHSSGNLDAPVPAAIAVFQRP